MKKLSSVVFVTLSCMVLLSISAYAVSDESDGEVQGPPDYSNPATVNALNSQELSSVLEDGTVDPAMVTNEKMAELINADPSVLDQPKVLSEMDARVKNNPQIINGNEKVLKAWCDSHKIQAEDGARIQRFDGTKLKTDGPKTFEFSINEYEGAKILSTGEVVFPNGVKAGSGSIEKSEEGLDILHGELDLTDWKSGKLYVDGKATVEGKSLQTDKGKARIESTKSGVTITGDTVKITDENGRMGELTGTMEMTKEGALIVKTVSNFRIPGEVNIIVPENAKAVRVMIAKEYPDRVDHNTVTIVEGDRYAKADEGFLHETDPWVNNEPVLVIADAEQNNIGLVNEGGNGVAYRLLSPKDDSRIMLTAGTPTDLKYVLLMDKGQLSYQGSPDANVYFDRGGMSYKMQQDGLVSNGNWQLGVFNEAHRSGMSINPSFVESVAEAEQLTREMYENPQGSAAGVFYFEKYQNVRQLKGTPKDGENMQNVFQKGLGIPTKMYGDLDREQFLSSVKEVAKSVKDGELVLYVSGHGTGKSVTAGGQADQAKGGYAIATVDANKNGDGYVYPNELANAVLETNPSIKKVYFQADFCHSGGFCSELRDAFRERGVAGLYTSSSSAPEISQDKGPERGGLATSTFMNYFNKQQPSADFNLDGKVTVSEAYARTLYDLKKKIEKDDDPQTAGLHIGAQVRTDNTKDVNLP